MLGGKYEKLKNVEVSLNKPFSINQLNEISSSLEKNKSRNQNLIYHDHFTTSEKYNKPGFEKLIV